MLDFIKKRKPLVRAICIIIFAGLVVQFFCSHFIFSATPSAGGRFFWRKKCTYPIHRYELVEIRPPANDPFVPRGITLLKHAMCFDGEVVIREGTHFFCITREGFKIDMGPIKFKSRDGKPLHPFLENGRSYIIPHNHIFLMGDKTPHSYDSRYFGPVSEEDIISCPAMLF